MRRRFAITSLVVLSVIVAASFSGARLGALFDAQGSANALALLKGFTSPDVSPDFLARIARLSLESLLIGVLGTTLAAVLGFVLAVLGTRVPQLPDPPGRSWLLHAAAEGFRFCVRFVLAVFRSIPDIVWAYLFVRVLGLGPGPAILALAVSTGGIIGKLFAELAEAVDPAPIHALRRAGVGRFGIFVYAVLPQVQRQWVGYLLFRLECSIRSASILGVVGAGGLGSEIALSIRYFEYEKLATALIAVLAYVIVTEIIGAFLRRRSIRWTLWSVAIASAVSIWYLPIPWSALFSASPIPDWLTVGAGDGAASLATRAIPLCLETVAMAWCATIGAAVLAFLAAPFAASTLTVGSYLRDSPQGRGITRVVPWTVLVTTRFALQVCRAMPELTLALIFVVWVGPGPFAGVLAVGLHTVGVLGRLYTDVYEEVERGPVGALESTGASRLGIWLYGVVPQVTPRILAFTLYRFEVNVRATTMVGFVGAGGIGDAIHTALSLFHVGDLGLLLLIILAVVTLFDWAGDRLRYRILTARFGAREGPRGRPRVSLGDRSHLPEGELLPAPLDTLQPTRQAAWKSLFYRRSTKERFDVGSASSVSASGMFIHVPRPYPPGLVIEVAMAPPYAKGEEDLVACVARVAYMTEAPEAGMGVELLDPSARFLELLEAPAPVLADAKDGEAAGGERAAGEGSGPPRRAPPSALGR